MTAVFFFVLFVLVGAPLALVVTGVLLFKRERRTLLAAVEALGCPVCRGRLWHDSIQAADNLWARHVATLRLRNPGVMLRLVRRLAAVCGACGARLQFDPGSGTLRPITVVLAFETGETDEPP